MLREGSIAMNPRLATTSALGAALALAFTLSTAVGPAFAETPKIDVIPSRPPIHRNLGPLPSRSRRPRPSRSIPTCG